MTALRTPESGPVDPVNGFRRTFHYGARKQEYSMVLVPSGVYFRMEYERPFSSVNMDLDLVDLQGVTWSVMGQIDADTYTHLGLPASLHRRITGTGDQAVSEAPLITAADLAETRRNYGFISLADQLAGGEPLYKTELELPPDLVAGFLSRIWTPDFVPGERELVIPEIVTGLKPGQDRYLPQKIPYRSPHLARLQVFSD